MSRPAAAYGTIVALAVLCTALAAALLVVWKRGAPGAGPTLAERAIEDPELRRAAVAELVARSGGVWDTFADPDVGLLLQPGLEGRVFLRTSLETNGHGLRERDYVPRKPPGTVRVVMLGDSFVMGQSVEAHERFGARLEQFLQERAQPGHPPIEVLHLGLNMWNILSETSFLIRQLSTIRPDLVVHLVVRNDLEDRVSARGFGEISNVNPEHPERGAGIFQVHHPGLAFGTGQPTWLSHGLDWESRSRFEASGAAIGRLAQLLRDSAARYLLLDYFTGLLPLSRKYFTAGLQRDEVAYLPTAMIHDPALRVSEQDAHWNPPGHELAAKLVYSLIRARGLLPQLTLQEWPEADALAADWLARGEQEAAAEPDLERYPGRRRILPRLDFARIDADAGAQVHGGIFGGGLVTPYASMILRCEGRRTLALQGAAFDRRELDGTRVEVLVDEARVGELVLERGRRIDVTFQVPQEVAERRFVSVRLQASDYAYAEVEIRLHVVFDLDVVEFR